MKRRQFLKRAAGLGGVALAAPLMRPFWIEALQAPRSRVAFVKTSNRADGVRRAVELLRLKPFGGRDLFIKPNYNSADETPGSTHIDTLTALVKTVRDLGAGRLTLGDRSGMGRTRDVLEARRVFALATELDFRTVVFDELPAEEWQPITLPDMHWQKGFSMPRSVLKAGGIISTCCLKTHRFGGHFTLSLKNSVGLAARQLPSDSYNYMRELHGSPHQRRMIAEINAAYRPDLIVLDGVDALVTGGPDTGKAVNADVVLAGTDRVAVDAIGVALLRYYGTTPEVSQGGIFQQEQIARAVELKLGVPAPEQIEIVTGDRESADYAAKIRPLLQAA
jgi:uncharacterized protein (DUF362 family)